MSPIDYPASRIEKGPEADAERLASYIEGYSAADAGWRADSILTDLQDRISSGELSEDEASYIADSLGL